MKGVILLQLLLVFILVEACSRKPAARQEDKRLDAVGPVAADTISVQPEPPSAEGSLLLPKTEPHLFASLKHTSCYGHCPVYEIQFYSNGQALYKGEKNVLRQGIYLGTVSDSTIQQIMEKARDINFFSLSDAYPEKGKPIADLPQTIIYLNDGKQEKTIVNNHLAPVGLINFERFLDKLAEEIWWQPKVE
ncbi:MAG: hypothetical protein J5I94_18395 [Phaeodactylibacter sp.]|nr:hypothetical protein [Phaeodactylibacter sp.]